jgi:hypothetical protein
MSKPAGIPMDELLNHEEEELGEIMKLVMPSTQCMLSSNLWSNLPTPTKRKSTKYN